MKNIASNYSTRYFQEKNISEMPLSFFIYIDIINLSYELIDKETICYSK